MAAWGYEFYLLVLKVFLTSERSERLRDTYSHSTELTGGGGILLLLLCSSIFSKTKAVFTLKYRIALASARKPYWI